MNRLYSILVNPLKVSGWYKKQTEDQRPLITKNSQAIKDILLTNVPTSSLAMFACVVCDMVMYSTFGAEIQKLDSNNTYFAPGRPSDATHNNPAYCFHQLIQPAAALRDIRYHLDQDILDRTNMESWLDIMAAGCLQMLRET